MDTFGGKRGPPPGGNVLQYLRKREMLGLEKRAVSDLVEQEMSTSQGNFFRKNLCAHFGCVNAVEFSGDGEMMASGGDDRRIILWNVGRAIVKDETPKVMDAEHRSNVFAISFDAAKEKLISAGNDDQCIIHDINTQKPIDFFLQEQPVFGIGTDPINKNVFSIAGDDGRILIFDMRDSSEPFCLAKYHSAFHSVMFHPSEPRIILTANAKEGAGLWDVRMPKRVLLKYGLRRGDHCCMNARFNQTGSQVLTLRRRLPPALYSTNSPSHLFQFNHSSYYNSCTMKSCCFGGPGDQFVLSGSDNFDLHAWKIPQEGSDRWVNDASFILRGHRSIVNQVRYNYAHQIVASSGVEKMIKLWSPFSIPDESCWEEGETTGKREESPRQIFSHEEYVRIYMRNSFFSASQVSDSERDVGEDSRMLAFFDALVQRDIAGLSDEDTDQDSTYTNTVYSTENSSDDDDGEDISQLRNRRSPSPSRPEDANDQQENCISPTPSNPTNIIEDNQDDLVDIDDLPIVISDDSEPEALGSQHEDEDDDDESEQQSTAIGSAEPNTLTKLIETREIQLRKLASHPSKGKPTSELQPIPGTSQQGIMSHIIPSVSDSNESDIESPDSPLVLRSHRSSVQTTPVYETSYNSPTYPDDRPGNSQFQLISQLMTRGRVVSRELEVTDTSSSSSSSPSSASSSCEDESPETTKKGNERNKRSKREKTSSFLKRKSTADSSDSSLNAESTKRRKRRRKMPESSEYPEKTSKGTPSDSGIDVSNQPGCSSSNTFGKKRNRVGLEPSEGNEDKESTQTRNLGSDSDDRD